VVALRTIGVVILVFLITFALGCTEKGNSPTTGSQSPSISYQLLKPKIQNIKVNQARPGGELKIEIRAKAERIILEMETPLGVRNYTMERAGEIFTLKLKTDEGVYRVLRVYAFLKGEKTVKKVDKSIEVFDKPQIKIEAIAKRSNEFLIKIALRDYTRIREAFMEVNGAKKTLERADGCYQAVIAPKNPEKAEIIDVKIIARDAFNNTGEKELSLTWTWEDALKCYIQRNFNESLSELFGGNGLLQQIYMHDENLAHEILSVASENQDLALKLLEKSEGSIMKARFYFDIISNTGVFSVRNETLKALDYYVKAVMTGELPMHDYNALRLFLEAANRNPELVDFEPIIVKDNYGHRVIIDSYNKPRDTWMIVEFIKRNPYVASDDNLYLPVNMLIKEMAWNFFDNKFGPRYADKHHNDLSDEELNKIYQPDSKDIWYIIQKLWDYYYNGIGKRYQYVKWWDKQEFAKQYPTELERKLILIGLWDLPNQVADLNHTHPDIRGGWDYDVVWGLRAQKLFVDQLEQMYDILEQTRTTSKGKWEYNWGWYQWIIDRGHWNLPNMFVQFIGTQLDNVYIPFRGEYDDWNWYENIMQYNGVDQFLAKNFADYERVKVAYGYTRYYGPDYGGEMPTYYYGLTLAFKAYGIPTILNSYDERTEYSGIYIYPNPYGQPGSEFMFPLPKEIRDLLKQKYGNSIVFTPEGGFGMYSLKDGLEKDCVERIYTYYFRNPSIQISDYLKYRIVLWKK